MRFLSGKVRPSRAALPLAPAFTHSPSLAGQRQTLEAQPSSVNKRLHSGLPT